MTQRLPHAFATTVSVLLCLPVAAQSRPTPTKPQQGLVATVGTVRITVADLRAETNRLLPLTFFHSRVKKSEMDRIRAQALEKLVEKALLYQDARQRGITATAEEIRAEFTKALEKAGPRYKNLPDQEKAALLEQYRPLVIRRILLDKNEARFLSSLPPVDETAVRRRYEENKDRLLAPVEAHLQHILIKVAPSASDREIRALQQRIAAARKELQDGQPFAAVAKKYSEDIYTKRGGDLGFVKQGGFLHGPVDVAAFELKEGELSEVISSIYGFHLVRCVKIKPRRTLRLEEVRKVLAAQLQAETREQAREGNLAKLRTRFPVKIHQPVTAGSRPTSRPVPATMPSKLPDTRPAR
ncbi:MAG: peptidylprolyl isomerase [Planctomycetota bacterium]|jgi:parvulin-like peptidyl-prolyl isomerase